MRMATGGGSFLRDPSANAARALLFPSLAGKFRPHSDKPHGAYATVYATKGPVPTPINAEGSFLPTAGDRGDGLAPRLIWDPSGGGLGLRAVSIQEVARMKGISDSELGAIPEDRRVSAVLQALPARAAIAALEGVRRALDDWWDAGKAAGTAKAGGCRNPEEDRVRAQIDVWLERWAQGGVGPPRSEGRMVGMGEEDPRPGNNRGEGCRTPGGNADSRAAEGMRPGRSVYGVPSTGEPDSGRPIPRAGPWDVGNTGDGRAMDRQSVGRILASNRSMRGALGWGPLPVTRTGGGAGIEPRDVGDGTGVLIGEGGTLPSEIRLVWWLATLGARMEGPGVGVDPTDDSRGEEDVWEGTCLAEAGAVGRTTLWRAWGLPWLAEVWDPSRRVGEQGRFYAEQATRLRQEQEAMILACLAENTIAGYSALWVKWATYAQLRGAPEYLVGETAETRTKDEEELLMYVAYLACELRKAAAGIKQALFAIRFRHLQMGYTDPLQGKRRLWMALKGLAKITSKGPRKLPTTPAMLAWIRSRLDPEGKADDAMMWFCLTAAFFFLMRIGEYAFSTHWDRDKVLTPEGLKGRKGGKWCSDLGSADEIVLTFRASKTDQEGAGATRNHYRTGQELCVVKAAGYMHKHFGARNKVRSKEPLCRWKDGSPVTRGQIQAVLERAAVALNLPPDRFRSHSLRIGGATALYHVYHDTEIIKRWGRWKSTSFHHYLWEADQDAKGVAARMANDTAAPMQEHDGATLPAGGGPHPQAAQKVRYPGAAVRAKAIRARG